MVTSRPARNPNVNKAASRENAQAFNTEAFTWKLPPEDFDGNDGLDRDHVLGPLRGLLYSLIRHDTWPPTAKGASGSLTISPDVSSSLGDSDSFGTWDAPFLKQ